MYSYQYPDSRSTCARCEPCVCARCAQVVEAGRAEQQVLHADPALVRTRAAAYDAHRERDPREEGHAHRTCIRALNNLSPRAFHVPHTHTHT